VISPTTNIKIICIKVGKAIRIKVLDGNMLIHPTHNLIFNDNHFILQFRRERVHWRIPHASYTFQLEEY